MSRREYEIERIINFVHEHPGSYASLAVCRRALDAELEQVTGSVVQDLRAHLDRAPDDEVNAYFSIVM